MAYLGRIMARSPHYITAHAATMYSAHLELYILSGSLSTPPTTPTYVMDKLAKTPTATDIVFEISHIVRDYFEHKGDVYEGGNSIDALWVKYSLTYVMVKGGPVSTVSDGVFLALDGYGEFKEGVNPDGEIPSLLDIISRDLCHKTITYHQNYLYLPLFVNRADGVTNIELKYKGAVISSEDFTTQADSDLSTDKIVYYRKDLMVGPHPILIDEVILYNGANQIASIKIHPATDRHGINSDAIRDIRFLNRSGLLQNFYFLARTIEKIEVKHDYYNSMIGHVVANNYTYDTQDHVKTALNTTGIEVETINTNWIPEEMNEAVKQLLLSERIWSMDYYDYVKPRPIIIRTSTIKFLTRKYEKLINYTLDIEYSNNIINEV